MTENRSAPSSEWTRAGFSFTDGCGHTQWLDLVGQSNGPASTAMFDRLMADANKWLTNEAAFNRQAEVIAAFVKATRAIQADRVRRRAITTNQWQESLFDALALAEPEPEAAPLTITVPPDTADEIVALLTKVAKLLEKKGGE